MGAVRRLVDELRRRGVIVHEWPGWDGRGNADGGVGPRITQIDPIGAVIHHTGSPYGSAYAGLVSSTRPDLLGGCLCNFAGNEDGSLSVIASGLAWHAGPGVGPSMGRVLGKVPNIRNRMNRLTVGLEIVYPGRAPMRPAQYRAALIFAETVADLFAGGDIESVRAHAETNGDTPGGSGKWDPGFAPSRTIDMAAFRRDAAAYQEDDMSAEDVKAIRGDISFIRDQIRGDVGFIRDQILPEVTALRATVTALAASGSNLTAEQIEAAVGKALQENVVKVDVSVGDKSA